jgi:hypothetical protein
MKIDPLAQTQLESYEIYLMNFWTPEKGHKILFNNKHYEIEEIITDNGKETAQVKVKGLDEIIWLQDAAWKPSLKDLDKIVEKFGGEVLNDTISLISSKGKRCFFTRPDSVEMYEKILKDVRVYNLINGVET